MMTVGGGVLALLLGVVLVIGIGSGAFSQATFAKNAVASPNEQSQSDEVYPQSGVDPMSGEEAMSGETPMSGEKVDNRPQSGDEVIGTETIVTEDAIDCDCGPEFEYHDVTDLDTLSSISEEYGVSVDKIADFNDLWDVNLIYTGSTLRIPMLQD